MNFPNHQKFRLPLLEFISDQKCYKISDCTEHLGKILKLTENQQKELLPKNKRTRLYDRIYWAKNHLTQAGLIQVCGSGTFKISHEGEKVLQKDLGCIDDAFLLQYAGFKEFLNKRNNSSKVEEHRPIQENHPLEIGLLKKLKELSPDTFEVVVLNFLYNMGYGYNRENINKNIKRTHDGGIDGYIELDILGIDRVYIQAKRWDKTTVGVELVERFAGSLDSHGGNKGVFITTSTFSRSAIASINRIRNKSIILIDGKRLVNLMMKHKYAI